MTRRPARWFLWAAMAVVLVALGIVWIANPARDERDIAQERLDKAALSLSPQQTVGQTFLASQDGLQAVEIQLVVYDRGRALSSDSHLVLTLESLDHPDESPVRLEQSLAGYQHNQIVRLSFAPLCHSGGSRYRLTLSCDADVGVACWYSSSEAYSDGEMLVNGQANGGDLRFVTYYAYDLHHIVADTLRQWGRWARYLPALLLVLGLPGVALGLWLLPRHGLDGWSRLGLVIALSLVSWPLTLLWVTTVGGNLAGGRVGWAVAGWCVLGVAGVWWRRRRPLVEPMEPAEPRSYWPGIVMAVIMLLTVATRFEQVRALLLPAWVDSLHHTLLTQLVLDRGVVPVDARPYMDVTNLHYHWGFHANAAALAWFGGLDAAQAVLLLGQVMEVLAPLAVYALAVGLTKKRWAGVGAALVTSAVSYMPAYYASWGRYTHLAGLNLLCWAIVVMLAALAERRDGWRPWVLAALLAAGLALVHYRVLIFYLLFVAPLAVLAVWRERWLSWRIVIPLGLAAIAAVTLIAPWAWHMATHIIPDVGTLYGGWEALEGSNTFPVGVFGAQTTQILLIVAAAGALWGLLRRRGEIVALGVWVGGCLLISNPHWVGLPDLWLLSSSSVAISYWVPMSVLCGWLLGDLWDLLISWARRWRWHPGYAALPALLSCVCIVTAGWGSWQRVDCINTGTVLVTADDMRAMTWVRDNTPADARILVNSHLWTGELRAGSDAGWWLPFVAQRQVTQPTVLYQQGTAAYYQQVNDLGRYIDGLESFDDPALCDRLLAEGIDYVFVGTKGGTLQPPALDASPYFKLVYSSGAARVYAFVADP